MEDTESIRHEAVNNVIKQQSQHIKYIKLHDVLMM